MKFILIFLTVLFSLFTTVYADNDPKVDYCVKAYTLTVQNTGTTSAMIDILGDSSHRYHYEYTYNNGSQNANSLILNSGGSLNLSMYHHL